MTSLKVYISFSAIIRSDAWVSNSVDGWNGGVFCPGYREQAPSGEKEKKKIGGLDSVYIRIYLELVPSVTCCNAFRFGRIFSLQQKMIR